MAADDTRRTDIPRDEVAPERDLRDRLRADDPDLRRDDLDPIDDETASIGPEGYSESTRLPSLSRLRGMEVRTTHREEARQGQGRLPRLGGPLHPLPGG